MREQLVLVGGYAKPGEPGIHAFGFDPTTGALAARGSYAGPANPSFLALHPDGARLFAVSETGAGDAGPGAVLAFQMGRAPWGLAAGNGQPSGGDWPCHLTLDGGGRWLAVSNYGSGTLRLIPLDPAAGGLGEPGPVAQHSGRGPNAERQDGPHAHSAIFAPDNRFLIAADLGIDRLLVYAFDADAGRLRPHAEAAARPGAGPRHLAFHPAGHLLYVANELDNTVAAYGYSPADGGLIERQVLPTIPAGAGHSQVADIHLSGGRLYISNRGHNSIAVFQLGDAGELEHLVTQPCGGDWPRNFALAPGGGHILVANQNSGELVVLPLLDGPAAIGAPLARARVPGAACVIFAGEAEDA